MNWAVLLTALLFAEPLAAAPIDTQEINNMNREFEKIKATSKAYAEPIENEKTPENFRFRSTAQSSSQSSSQSASKSTDFPWSNPPTNILYPGISGIDSIPEAPRLKPGSVDYHSPAYPLGMDFTSSLPDLTAYPHPSHFDPLVLPPFPSSSSPLTIIHPDPPKNYPYSDPLHPLPVDPYSYLAGDENVLLSKRNSDLGQLTHLEALIKERQRYLSSVTAWLAARERQLQIWIERQTNNLRVSLQTERDRMGQVRAEVDRLVSVHNDISSNINDLNIQLRKRHADWRIAQQKNVLTSLEQRENQIRQQWNETTLLKDQAAAEIRKQEMVKMGIDAAIPKTSVPVEVKKTEKKEEKQEETG